MAINNTTDIANYALNSINAGSIMSIDTPDRVSGICKKYVDLALIQTISEGEYSSTKFRASLTLNPSSSRPDYLYCYYLPLDYVKGHSLESGEDYEIEAKSLFTNDDAPVLLYFRKMSNYGLYQPFVLDVVALTLATMICMEVKGDSNTLSNTIQQVKLMTRRAKAHDRSERNGAKKNPTNWSSFNEGYPGVE